MIGFRLFYLAIVASDEGVCPVLYCPVLSVSSLRFARNDTTRACAFA